VTRTPRRCWPVFRASASSSRWSRSGANRRTRSASRPAAGLRRAARAPTSAVTRYTPTPCSSKPGTRPPAGTPMNGNEPLVRVENLTKHFPVRKGILLQREVGQVRAVDGVEFTVPKGASFGLVGESGSGKTTVAKILLRIETPTAGAAYFRGKDIFRQSDD